MTIFADANIINMTKTELRIREICREKGITQADLAERLGIRRDSFSQAVSRNNFDLEYLRRIATALDVELWELFKADALVCPHCGKPIKVKLE